MTRRHLSEDQLLGYVAGIVDEGTAVLVACHLTLCPACRDRLAEHEAVHGALADGEPAEMDVDALLARSLDALSLAEVSPAPQARFDRDGVLPGPLAQHVGDFSRLPWQWAFPEVRMVQLRIGGCGMPVRLFELAAGSRVADHTHEGFETTLVLTGGFTDDEGHFERGDVAVRDGSAVHRQLIDTKEPCVVLVVAENPLLPNTIKGWIASKVRRF